MNNIYILPSLVAALVNMGLGTYICLSGRNSRINMVLSLFLFSISITAIGEFLSRASGDDLVKAVFWHTFTIAGGMLAVWLFIYFALIFPREVGTKRKVLGKTVLAALFITGTFFTATAIAGAFSVRPNDIAPNSLGFYSVSDMGRLLNGGFHTPGVVYLGIMAFAGIAIILWRYPRENTHNKRALRLVLLGVGFMYVTGFFTELALPIVLTLPIKGLSDIGISVMGVILVYAVHRYKSVIIQPAREEKVIDLKSPLERGYTYFVIEDNYKEPVKSYDAFCEHVKGGLPGLIITSRNPAEIRKKYGLEKTSIVHITDGAKQSRSSETRPTDIIEISPAEIFGTVEPATGFISGSEDRIILVDCYEFFDDIFQKKHETYEEREAILRGINIFFKTLRVSRARVIVATSASWLNAGEKASVVKTDSLISSSNYAAILLFEYLCNQIIKNLNRESEGEVPRVIERLARVDRFFLKIKYDDRHVTLNYSQTAVFNYHDAIHYLRLFIAELSGVAATGVSDVKKLLAEFGLSGYEYDMEPGHGYLINLPSAGNRTDFFMELTGHGYRGLYIGRNRPTEHEKKPDGTGGRAKFCWITEVGSGENAILPKLEHIRKEIEDFIKNSSGYQKIVVLGNPEYLTRYAGSFDETHLFIASMRDIVTENNGIFALVVAKDALSPGEKAALIRELEELDYAGAEKSI